MSKKLQLSIPTPCHENWDAMTPVQQGKFCGSCEKQVVDFSNMSDRQVAEFFKKPSTGSVCGRFMTEQLDRDIEIPKKRIPWLKYFFQFIIPAFLVSIKASAQTTKGRINVNAVATDTTIKSPKPLLIDQNIKLGMVARPVCTKPLMGDINITPVEKPVMEQGIKGRIIDAESELPLTTASVSMVSTIGTEKIKIQDNGSFVLNDIRKITIHNVVFSLSGYETRNMSWKEFLSLGNENHIVKMQRERMLKGEIIVNTCRKPLMGDTIITPVKHPDDFLKGEVSNVLDQRNRTINGVVTDETGTPLPGVSIIIKGSRTGAAADNSGQFRILAKTGNFLIASGAGLETTEVVVSSNNTISIAMKSLIYSGKEIVVTAGMIHVTRRVRKEIKNVPLMKETQVNPLPNFFKVFPNPIESGNNLNIEIKKAEEGYYLLQLLNQSGQSVHQQDIWIDSQAKLLNIDMPHVAAGNYFILLTNKKSGKKFTEKIIIQ